MKHVFWCTVHGTEGTGPEGCLKGGLLCWRTRGRLVPWPAASVAFTLTGDWTTVQEMAAARRYQED